MVTSSQTAVSILFVGYVLMQGEHSTVKATESQILTIPVPSNLFLKSIGKPAYYLPTAMGLWGLVSGATGAVQSFGGLVACRVIVGVLEAAYWVRYLRTVKSV